MSGPTQNQAPNPNAGRPFLWAELERVRLPEIFGPQLDQRQLDACRQFWVDRTGGGAQGPLSEQEQATLMRQLGLQQASQTILSRAGFNDRAAGRGQSNEYNNLPAQLLSSPGSVLGMATYSYACMQRLEAADPELWSRLMAERDYAAQNNGATSRTFMDTAYAVYVAASQLVAVGDPDYLQDSVPELHLLH